MNKFSLSLMREIKKGELPDMASIVKSYKRLRPIFGLKEIFKDNINIIAEIKKSSPSHGAFNTEIADEERINSYIKGGACAISILGEEKFFGGSYHSIRDLSVNVNLPILCKDFVFYKEQIDAAFICGADIILLIARALSLLELKELYDYTTSIGLAPLVEVTSNDDLKKALKIDPEIIMINMRDLESLRIDFAQGLDVMKKIPQEIETISASAIENKEDLLFIKQKGKINNFLIGSALMKSRSPEIFIRELKNVC
ncbi:MAG TPA: indole-3-glycerol-phosphate synthase [Spirochaetota bacterium]|nr:indole-3-glycerol-phosphate synthase [Spirochaetota bacterium]